MADWTVERIQRVCDRIRSIDTSERRREPANDVQAEDRLPFVVQHRIDGASESPDEHAFSWWWTIDQDDNGHVRLDAGIGEVGSPTITVEASSHTAESLSNGTASAGESFLFGSLRVAGDVSAAMKHVDDLRYIVRMMDDTNA